MVGYLCLEIIKNGSILSISAPENNSWDELLSTETKNILQCWDAETNKKMKDHIDLVFNASFPVEFSLSFKECNLQFIGHKFSDEKAFIYVKPPEGKKVIEDKEWTDLVHFSYQNAGTSIFFVREDATFYECNEKAASLHGYSREELLKMCVFDLNPFFSKEMWEKGWKNLEKNRVSLIETKHQRKDGTVIDVIVNNNLIEYGNKKFLCGYVTDITESKKIEERLHLVDFAFKKTTVSILITKEDGSFYDFNEAALDLYGYTQEEMVNLTLVDLSAIIKKEDAHLGISRLWSRMKEHKTFTYYSKHKKKDDCIIDVEIRMNYILYDGIELNCAFIIDITDAKKTEEALKKSIERYEYATNAASDVIWEADFTENTYFLTKNYTTYFGHPSGIYQELYHNEWIRNIHPDDLDNVIKVSNAAIKSEENKWVSEYRLKKADGSYATVIDKAFVLRDATGKVLKLIGSLNDITQRKDAEREREKLIKELMISNNELKQFSYITTHNLRAPLTNLLSICSLLNTDGMEDIKTRRLIDGFKTSTNHLNDTLNDLINILIIKENTNLPIIENNLKRVLDKVLSSISLAIEKKGASLNVDFSEADTVKFNAPYLESVFLNLLTNSLKYAQLNVQPIIKIKTTKLSDGVVRLTFSDNGIGMNMKTVKDKIFGLYQKFHSNSDGKGIGLYLIHSEITAMGGTIEVDSKVNAGTTFTINFKG